MKLTYKQGKALRDAIDVLGDIQTAKLAEARTIKKANERKGVMADIESLMELIDLLDDVTNGYEVDEEEPEPELIPVVVEKKPEPEEDFGAMLKKEEEQSKYLRGRFRRELIGGKLFVPERAPIFIPETIVQSMNLEQDDLVEATQEGWLDTNIPKYFYKIIEKIGGFTPRVEAIGTIEKDAGEYFVTVEDQAITLEEHILERFKADVGDVVTVVYWSNNPTYPGKITRLHDETSPIVEKIMEATAKKKAIKKEEPKEQVEKVLAGYTICVLCLEGPQVTNYRDMLTELGATFEHLGGDISKMEAQGAMRRSDGLVYVTDCCTHGAYWVTKEVAESFEIPSVYSPGTGISSMRTVVIDELLPLMEANRENA